MATSKASHTRTPHPAWAGKVEGERSSAGQALYQTLCLHPIGVEAGLIILDEMVQAFLRRACVWGQHTAASSAVCSSSNMLGWSELGFLLVCSVACPGSKKSGQVLCSA